MEELSGTPLTTRIAAADPSQAITLAGKLHELHGSLSVDHNFQARSSTQERHQAQGGWDEESMMLSSK